MELVSGGAGGGGGSTGSGGTVVGRCEARLAEALVGRGGSGPVTGGVVAVTTSALGSSSEVTGEFGLLNVDGMLANLAV